MRKKKKLITDESISLILIISSQLTMWNGAGAGVYKHLIVNNKAIITNKLYRLCVYVRTRRT